MVYPVRCMMSGFTFRESMTLWKQKLQLFNPRTYEVLMFIWLKMRLLWLRVSLFGREDK